MIPKYYVILGVIFELFLAQNFKTKVLTAHKNLLLECLAAGPDPRFFLPLVLPRMWPRVRLQKILKLAFNILLREYIEYSKDLPRVPFTMIPPRLSHRFSYFLAANKNIDCVKSNLLVH